VLTMVLYCLLCQSFNITQ